MITGANTNIRHRGILFHVQTEDSGRANPHIISHLYHGGTILGTHKTDYSDRLDAEDLVGVVRGLIEEQHAAMLARLRNGGFDEVIGQRLGDTAADSRPGAGAVNESKPDTEPDAREPRTEGAAVAAREAAPPALSGSRGERTFGEGVGAQKPLDEVILEYLAEKARGRTAERSGTTRPKTRTAG